MKKLSVIAEVIIIICCGAIFLLTKPITTLGGMEPESASLCFHMITWITIVKPIVWTAAFPQPEMAGKESHSVKESP